MKQSKYDFLWVYPHENFFATTINGWNYGKYQLSCKEKNKSLGDNEEICFSWGLSHEIMEKGSQLPDGCICSFSKRTEYIYQVEESAYKNCGPQFSYAVVYKDWCNAYVLHNDFIMFYINQQNDDVEHDKKVLVTALKKFMKGPYEIYMDQVLVNPYVIETRFD